MSFRFLIADTCYNQFLRSFYCQHKGLGSRPYQEQHEALMAQCFGWGNFYSSNLRQLGYEAEEVVANCEPLQLQWAVENQVPLLSLISVRSKPWLLKVLAAQVEKTRPDVLYIRDIGFIDGSFLREIRPRVGLIVGQVACPLVPNIDFKVYDLIISSLPNYVEMFRDMGIPSQYLRLAFEPTVLERLGQTQPSFSTVFIGSYDASHYSGNQFLEQVAREIPVSFWGQAVESLSRGSPIRHSYCGEAWGIDMYRIFAWAKIVLNRHVDIAGRYANNIRLYEATGVGTLLVTDAKDNLCELFEVGREVVSYSNAQECIALVKYYLEHENERIAIARAGQQRTLREHTYRHRMEELTEIIKPYLQQPERASQRVILPAPEQESKKRRSLSSRLGLLLIKQVIRLRRLIGEPLWQAIHLWQQIVGRKSSS